ncbi:MAG: phosphate ABC transporter permease subunit PstC [Acidobacteria bacterium]|nr:phosphate ABC transporter permease subunit PstC [Acidobacteriota bacterium]
MKGTWIRWASYGATAVALVFVGALVGSLAWESLPVWRQEGFSYLTGKTWHYRGALFGALPMIYGSAVVAFIALLLAAPLGLGAALFSAEYVPGRWRWAVKVPIELLAGVPSVVYGLLGLLLLRGWIYRLLEPFDPLSGDTLLTGGVLLAVMILPTVMTLADDALRGVGASQRRAARGLGLTRAESIWRVSLPQAAPGLAAALLLGFGRALGETIAVFLVVGRQDNQWPASVFSPRAWLEAGQTLTSKLGGSETFLAYGDPLHWGAIVGLGLILLILVGGLTGVAGRWLPQARRHA